MLRRGGHLALIRVCMLALAGGGSRAARRRGAQRACRSRNSRGIEVIGEGDDLTDAALPDFMRALSRPRLHRDAAADARLEGGVPVGSTRGIAVADAGSRAGRTGPGSCEPARAGPLAATSRSDMASSWTPLRHMHWRDHAESRPAKSSMAASQVVIGRLRRWRPPRSRPRHPVICYAATDSGWPGVLHPASNRQTSPRTHMKPARAAAFGAGESSLALLIPIHSRNHRGVTVKAWAAPAHRSRSSHPRASCSAK